MDFAVPADDRIKLMEWEKKDKYHNLARELKKLWNMKVTIIPVMLVTKGLLKGGRRTSGDHLNYSIIKKGQNTEKSSGDLMRLAVTQPHAKDHQLKVM